jgi:hypothetical protein
MSGPIHRFLAADHVRLATLLDQAVAHPDHANLAVYGAFRAGLLKHIGMEEKILIPTIQRPGHGEPLAMVDRLRLDHGALAALLVPTPTRAIVAVIRLILARHNEIEEGPGGLYDLCDAAASGEGEQLVALLRQSAEVPARPHNDDPKVMPAICRALRRAGYAAEANLLEAEMDAKGTVRERG